MAGTLRKIVGEVSRAASAKGTPARGLADPQRSGRGTAANIATNAVAGALVRRFVETPLTTHPKQTVSKIVTFATVVAATRVTVKHRHRLAPLFLLVGTLLAGLVFAHIAHGPGSVAALTVVFVPWLWWRMSDTRYRHRVKRLDALMERKAKLTGVLKMTRAQLERERSRREPKRWRPIERVYACSVLAAASGWLLAVALLHRAGPPMPGVLLVLWLPAAIIWWLHRRVRTEDTSSPEAPPEVPEADTWTRKVAKAGQALPGSHLEDVEIVRRQS